MVDDNLLNKDVARRILESEGARESVAFNGQEAVEHRVAHAGGVDAVLIDVQMPVLDGLDATRAIRGGLGLSGLPISGLTVGVSLSERERALAAGMNEVVGKPFDPPALVRCLRRWVVRAPDSGAAHARSTHAPRFLLLYGSLRERSYSKLLTLEAARLLKAMGGEVRIFDPTGLSLPDAAPENHPKVVELREAAAWSEGMVWTSPERHGAMTGIMKAQIDWISLSSRVRCS